MHKTIVSQLSMLLVGIIILKSAVATVLRDNECGSVLYRKQLCGGRGEDDGTKTRQTDR